MIKDVWALIDILSRFYDQYMLESDYLKRSDIKEQMKPYVAKLNKIYRG